MYTSQDMLIIFKVKVAASPVRKERERGRKRRDGKGGPKGGTECTEKRMEGGDKEIKRHAKN